MHELWYDYAKLKYETKQNYGIRIQTALESS